MGIAALAIALCAAPAQAGPKQESIFQDDDALLHTTPEEAERVLAELRDLGVDRVRLSVIWRNLAPGRDSAEKPASFTDPVDPAQYPAAEFDNLDHVISAAGRLGIGVLLNVRGGAPEWALGRLPDGQPYGRDAYKPSSADFASFVHMLGRRYDGTYTDENQERRLLPRVTAWSIWNEPNWGGLLQPQSERSPGLNRLHTVSPDLYRRLYRAALDGLQKSGHGGDTILIGETAPVGNAKLGELSHLRPARFLRDLFCLDRRLKPLRARDAKREGCDFDTRGRLHATGYAHHPYSVTSPPTARSRDREYITLADAGRLKAILDAAARAGRISARLPIWYTEFGYQTSPPDPFRGISLEAQAQWLMQAEHMTHRDRRVAALTQFLLRDDEPRTSFAVTDPRYWLTYQTGLTFADGTPKPAYAAYRLPIRVLGRPRRKRIALWGMVRPGANGVEQRVRIQHLAPGESTWATVAEQRVRSLRGYFTARVRHRGPGFYRFEWLGPGAEPSPGAAAAAGGGRPGGPLASVHVQVR